MASTRITYDKCASKLSIQRSTDPLQYRLFRPSFENCNECYSNNGPIGSKRDASSVKGPMDNFGDLVELESEISNRSIALNNCNDEKCNKGYLKNKSKIINKNNCNNKLVIEDTRFTKPLTEFRELSLINYFTEPHLHVNPQKHIQTFNNRNGTFTRKLAKDQYIAPKLNRLDDNSVLPKEKPDQKFKAISSNLVPSNK
jgi:hypothetical protein